MLFAEGVTTKAIPTEPSDRGLGMGTVLAEVRNLGGRVSLSSRPGCG